ncbi:MAG: lipopolysaccharide heptosyltransferase II [Elusimicrobia bacterium]|nr:lipopolysaccharide heptosyltransferase II [Elusimicrobiota bacterium]
MSSRVLVRAPNWLGDAVMCGPFLKGLLARGRPVDVLARPAVAGLFEGFPGLSEVLILKPDETLRSAARRLAGRGYAAAYALPPSFSAAALHFLARIPERVGHATDFRSFLLTRAVRPDERFHYTRRYLQLLGDSAKEPGPGDFYVPTADDSTMDAWVGARGIDARRLLILAPGSRAPARRWDPERFAAVADRAGSDWSAVLLLGAAEDRPVADAVAREAERPLVNLCGETPVPLAAALLRRAAALVTNESGMMHLGWAGGTPTVVVAGPSEPQATSPFGPRVRVIQHREIPCVPCVRNVCGRRGEETNLCLRAVGAEEVIAALAELSRR